MGVTSMALHVQKPLGKVEFTDYPESKFAVMRFEDGGYIHFSYYGELGIMEVVKDFCQAIIGSVEAVKVKEDANGS